MISRGIRDTIKDNVHQAADIVEVIGEYVSLKKTGTRLVGLCPFHSEKTPSFSVNPEKQFFYCFGCGASGDVFSFLMKYHHMEFPEALKALADKYQITLPEQDLSPAEHKRLQLLEQLYQVNQAAADFFTDRLFNDPGAATARAYLQHRKIPEDFARSYHLGYAPTPEVAGWTCLSDFLQKRSLPINAIEQAGLAVRKERGGHYDRFRSRVMFPIYDMTGRIVAFGGRILGDGKPKYMNSPESQLFDKSRLLFGLYQHKEAIRKSRTAIVVEGNFDLLSLAVHGIDNVVAPLGTSLTRQHVRSLRGYCREVVLLFDADAAGLRAAMRSIPFFLAERLDCRVALLPQGHDPDSFVREQGAAAIVRQVDEARPLPEFVFDTLVQQHGLTLHGKNTIVAELKSITDQVVDQSSKNLMIAHFSEKLGLPASQFSGNKPVVQKHVQEEGKARGSFEALPKRERQIIDFLILHPEYVLELQDAGLNDIVTSPVSQHLVQLITKMQQEENLMPEYLMPLLQEGQDRRYVAELLMRQSESVENDDNSVVQEMKMEMIQWLNLAGGRRQERALQDRIKEAEQQGDSDLLMELLQQKMQAGKKRFE